MDTALAVAQPVTLRHSYARFNQAVIRKYVDWLGMQGRSAHTLRSFGSHLRDFAAFLEARNILTAQHADLLQYLSGLYDRGLSKVSVVSYVHALRKFQRFLTDYGLPNTGALGRLKPPKVPSRIGDYHSLEEIEQLFAATEMPRERAILEMYFGTGCRISELHGVRVEQIYWSDPSVLIIVGKGDKERKVYFGRGAEKALRAYLQGRTEGWLFRPERERTKHGISLGQPNRSIPTMYWRAFWTEYDAHGKCLPRWQWLRKKEEMTHIRALATLRKLTKGKNLSPPVSDRPLSVRELSRIIKSIGIRAGLKTHVHKLRHSFATAMLNDGTGIRDLQEFLGHANISTTARYLHSSPADLIKTYRKYFEGEKGQ